ncbi:MAG: hypothetical protein KJT03_23555, partial [Verrucomicrobiae bacterium]|nr:hypothetical protein [Verrucomicrobiae bacterium]
LFQDANFGGDFVRVDKSLSSLEDLRDRPGASRKWNDTVSSIKIIASDDSSYAPGKGLPQAGTAFEDGEYRGLKLMLYEGQSIPNMQDSGWNDRISSIMVLPGYKIQVFQDANFKGDSTIFESHQQKLPGSWNDRISSIRVLKK